MTEEKAKIFLDKLLEIYARKYNIEIIFEKNSKGSKKNEEKKIKKMG